VDFQEQLLKKGFLGGKNYQKQRLLFVILMQQLLYQLLPRHWPKRNLKERPLIFLVSSKILVVKYLDREKVGTEILLKNKEKVEKKKTENSLFFDF